MASSHTAHLAPRPSIAQGSFRSLISAVEPRNVTEFSYRYGNDANASILLGFQA